MTIFANHIFSKGLVPKICKELSKLNSKTNKTNLIRKWKKDKNIHFTKKDKLMARKHMKRCFSSLITREK